MQYSKESMNRLSLVDGSMERRNVPAVVPEQHPDVMIGAIMKKAERLTLDGMEQSERVVLPAIFVQEISMRK